MVIIPVVEVDEKRLAAVCDKYGIAELKVFGSRARGLPGDGRELCRAPVSEAFAVAAPARAQLSRPAPDSAPVDPVCRVQRHGAGLLGPVRTARPMLRSASGARHIDVLGHSPAGDRLIAERGYEAHTAGRDSRNLVGSRRDTCGR